MKIGEVEKVKWYILEDDRVVSFHTAISEVGTDDVETTTFFSERQVLPSITARKLGVGYIWMRNATDWEVNKCIVEKGLQVKSIVELT